MTFMKHILTFGISLFLFTLSFAQSKIIAYDEPYRAQFHYTISENWMGSPVALFERDSIYYLYYLQNPHNLQPQYYQWGMATSTDLITWKEQPLSKLGNEIIPDSLENCMTWGSIDFSEGKAQTVFSRKRNGLFLSSSADGINWENAKKIESDLWSNDSEPFFFWHEQSKKWVIINYDREKKTIQVLNSNDLLSWEKKSEFSFKYGHPSLVELPVDGSSENTKWVLFCETGIYLICDFDGEKITPVSAIDFYDNGKSIQNSVFLKKGDHTIMISGFSGSNYSDLPTVGMMSFPNEISLIKKSNGYSLIRKPIKELEMLYEKDFSIKEKKVYPGLKNNPLSKLKGDCFIIKLEIDLQTCDEFNLLVRSDRMKNGSLIMYDVKRKFFNVLGKSVPYEPINGKIEFEVLVDRSSIELFLDHGEHCFSTSFNPTPQNYFVELVAIGGELIVDKMEAYSIKSIWPDKKK